MRTLAKVLRPVAAGIPVTSVLFVLMALPVPAATLVLPNSGAGAVGNDSSGSLAGQIASLEFQEIWDMSQFPSGNLLITGLAYRLKPNSGALNSTVTSASLYLSTTSFTPTTMTSTFATNRGADFTKVDSVTGTLWSSPGCTGSAPCPFDIVFNFTTPFLYNPANGDLLIEQQLTGFNATGTGQLDAQNYTVNPLVGEIVASPAGATGAFDFSGNVTQLTFTIPEPASLALALLGLGALAALRRRPV